MELPLRTATLPLPEGDEGLPPPQAGARTVATATRARRKQIGLAKSLFYGKNDSWSCAGGVSYYFDAGVYQAIRPRGPLDAPEEIHGAALETLFLQQARALNDYRDLGYRLHYWRTATGDEVDFVLYGERGLCAFEVKMAQDIRPDDLCGLLRFREDFPQAKAHLLYLGNRRWHDRGVEVLPFSDCVSQLDRWL